MDPLVLREAILCCPLTRRADRGGFDMFLAGTTAADLDALCAWKAAGLVKGDWRRAAISRRIEEIQREGGR